MKIVRLAALSLALAGLMAVLASPAENWAAAGPGLQVSTTKEVYLTGSPVEISVTAADAQGKGIHGLPVALSIQDAGGSVVYVGQEVTGQSGGFNLQVVPLYPAEGEFRILAVAGPGFKGETVFYYSDTPPQDTNESGGGPGAGDGGGQDLVSTPPLQTLLPGSGDVLKLDVDQVKGSGQGKVEVEVQPAQAVQLTGAAIQELTASGRDLHIKAARATVVLPATSLALVKESGGDLELVVSEPAAAGQTLDVSSAAAAVLALAGAVVDIEAVYKGTADGQEKKWSGPVQLLMAFNDDGLTADHLARLGIYRYEPDTDVWSYVGGQVNTEDATISAWLNGFSLYAVMKSEKSFSDLAGHWSRQDVEVMAGRQIVRGVDAGHFEPDRAITRAEFTSLLTRSLRLETATSLASPFIDVPEGTWYAPEVAAAYRAGFVTGVGGGRFAPDAAITREELAVMLARAAMLPRPATLPPPPGMLEKTIPTLGKDWEVDMARFGDWPAVSAWASEDVARTVALGILQGTPDAKLFPLGQATRAEATVMLKRFLDLKL